MPVTQSLNSKANVKKNTNQDLPFAPQQPVMASYYAVSTAGQTVINLSFSVDTVNLTDQFFLFVDGKKLRLGASNDYTFTSIAATGYSSQVTLNQSLAINLNIQAYNLGLKKESEFNVDNRFTQLYEAQDSGFQAFVNQNSFLSVATSTPGTPAAGTFYSTIVNRAAMSDLSQNLKAQMGIERMAVQSIYQIPNEFGPNGELVWASPNDIFNQLRLVGNWSHAVGIQGPLIVGASNGDFLEITFYGTGLNMLYGPDSTPRDYRASVDGGSEGSNLYTTGANVIISRGYSQNQVGPVVSGLTLGVHTVKIRNAHASANMYFYGFEILNESSLVKVNSGVGYVQGKKYTSAALQSFAYNVMATGTRGGRTVIYQNGDGTIGKAWQAVNGAQGNLTSADHTNEEVARTINFREFGAGRSDDFSTSFSASNRTFTLDDGTTTLVGQSAVITGVTGESIRASGATNYLTITFVGTGLDILTHQNDANNRVTSILVDGTSIGTLSTPLNEGPKVYKIVSGLPYGTHTVKFLQNTLDTVFTRAYIVYQPKKPTIPSGAVELADYNVMADSVVVTTAGTETISTGVLRKHSMREFTYVEGTGGTTSWTPGSLTPGSQIGGYQAITDRQNAYYEYTFFGTGFDLRYQSAGNRSPNIPLLINGIAATTTNYPGLTATALTGSSFATGTGLITMTASTTSGSGVMIRGLPLARYTIRLTNPSTGLLPNEALDIVTPIHSAKSNLYVDLQNTLLIDSQGISDNRKTTPVKGNSQQPKMISQAIGVTTTATNTSTSFVPLTDMSVVHANQSGKIRIDFTVLTSTTTANMQYIVYIDGVQAGQLKAMDLTNTPMPFTFADVFNVSPGVHKVDIYWKQGAGTGTANQRTLTVTEI